MRFSIEFMLLFIVVLLILLVGFPLGRHIRSDVAGYHVVMFLPKNTLRRVERESALWQRWSPSVWTRRDRS